MVVNENIGGQAFNLFIEDANPKHTFKGAYSKITNDETGNSFGTILESPEAPRTAG